MALRGGGLGVSSHRPRCLRIFSMTSSASMKAMTAIGPWHPSTGSGQAWDTSGDRFSRIKSGTGSDFLYQPCPVLAVPLGWFIGLQDGRHQSVLICLLPLTPTDVGVVAIVSNHLFSLVGNMGTPVCVRHAQAGMAASQSSASKVLSFFPSLER